MVQVAGVVAGFAALAVIEVDVPGPFDGAAGVVCEENIESVPGQNAVFIEHGDLSQQTGTVGNA